jgi:CBS domain-containing protein
MLLSIGVGIVAGLGAILFDRLLGWTLHVVLEAFTGYAEPMAGTPAASLFTFAPARSLWFFIVPAIGGLVSGVIVYLVAPEAEGNGTNAMIDAFHHHGGQIRKRVPFVKIVASVLTIGTGGSAVPSTSYLLLRNTSLYEKQQISRMASPAHLTEFARGMLERIRVHWNDTLQQALDKMAAIDVDEMPVTREEAPDEIVAMISKRDVVDYYYGRSTL